MPEAKRMNIGVRLMPACVSALDAAGERMGGKSRAFVIEVLTALFAAKLDGDTQVPVNLVPNDSRAKPQRKPKK